jgi:hypothetical protein
MASTKNIVQKSGWVYFLIDEPWLLLILRLIFQGAFKAKIGYTTNLAQRYGSHQTSNSSKVRNLVRPMRFRRADSAKKFETLCHRLAGYQNRVHGNGNGREWFWIDLRDLIRMRHLYLKLYRRTLPAWLFWLVGASRWSWKIIRFILNIPPWLIVFVLKAFLFFGKLSDLAYRPIQPYNRKFLRWVSTL